MLSNEQRCTKPKFFLLFSKSEHHVQRCPTSSTVPPQAPQGTGRRFKRFTLKRTGARSSRGSANASPKTQAHIFAGRLRRPAGRTRCEQAAFPPPVSSGTGAPPPPPPVMAPAPVPGLSGRRVRPGKGKPAKAPRKAGDPWGRRLTVWKRFLQQQQGEEHPEPHGGSGPGATAAARAWRGGGPGAPRREGPGWAAPAAAALPRCRARVWSRATAGARSGTAGEGRS